MKMLQEFYAFIRERESIRLRRACGEPREKWTKDPILAQYKFTNVKREHDHTTQVFVHDFYETHPDFSPRVKLLNCAVLRYFGTVAFARCIGWTEAWSAKRKQTIRRIAQERLNAGLQVFTGAYIVPNCGQSRPKYEVVLDILEKFWEGFATQWSHPDEQRVLVERLKLIDGVGSFMAKEVVLDYVLATGWRPTDWDTWTAIGPGARRGAARVWDGELAQPNGLSELKALEVCRKIYDARYKDWSLWPVEYVKLDLVDIQFQLCEFDKYQRALRGEGRPKQRFTPRVAEFSTK